MKNNSVVSAIEHVLFRFRKSVLVILALITVVMGYNATKLHVDAGFSKLLPMKHPYIQTLLDYQNEFGGGNKIIIALLQKDGDIFNAKYFDALKEVTDAVFRLPGVDKGRITSLFTPNVRYTVVTEAGFAGGPVIPSRFDSDSEQSLEDVRQNIINSGQLGRLVTTDFTGTLVTAELLDIDPETGERLDYYQVAQELEEIRARHDSDQFSVHIIGFAKSIVDIAEGATSVVLFFGIALVITAILLYLYSGSIKLSILPLVCSIVAVIWQLGLLTTMGFGLDPMSILVPFLVFAIGVSHGVQMISGWMGEILYGGPSVDPDHPVVPAAEDVPGVDGETAARRTFQRLIVPGALALASDTIGFLTVLLIEIGIIQEMAIAASTGVAVIIITNLVLMPILLSFTKISNLDQYKHKRHVSEEKRDRYWRTLARFTRTSWSLSALGVAAVLLVFGFWKGADLKIGDLHAGVPELREDSRYNIDARAVTESFGIGIDVLTVIAEAPAESCVDYTYMNAIDEFTWFTENLPGVQAVMSLPYAAKEINANFNEGSPKWQVLSRNRFVLSQSISPIQTNTGLLNASCEAMPILIFTEDHKAETIDHIVQSIAQYESGLPESDFRLRLASGNVGIMAATNEAVEAAQLPIMLYVYGAIIVLCLLTFRSVMGTLCIVLPLAFVSVLAYAVMAVLEIGLKTSTLPVVALGVGIGVDYGIYIYSRFSVFLQDGLPLEEAYYRALRLTGKPVLFTAFTLAVGVITWVFSPLKFQADMGILLTFMFVVNMLGAVVLLPALARWLLRPNMPDSTQ